MSKLKELREKRVAAATDLTAELKKEQSKETRAKVDEILADISTMEADIKRIEAADAVQRSLEAPVGKDVSGNVDVDPKKASADYRKAYMEYLLRGKQEEPRGMIKGGLRPENRAILEKAVRDMAMATSQEQRDQQAGVQTFNFTEGALGGYFVPAGFVYDVDVATKYFCPLMTDGNCRVMDTATGQSLPYPTANDTNEAWQVIGEGAQVTLDASNSNPSYPTTGTAPSGPSSDLSLGQVVFQAWKGTTGLIKISVELMQDSAFNLEAFLTEAFAVRLGRGYEYYFTKGSGNAQPKGILTAAVASGNIVTAAGSNANDGIGGDTSANSIGYADVVNLIHAVDPSYRRGAKFMLSDSTLAHLKTRLDKWGRPLWVPSMKEDAPDMLCGYSYIINQCFPTIAASATTMAFGPWNKFIIRRVKDMQVIRLSERFADFGQVAYLAFSRVDSALIDSGMKPIALLQQHS